MAAGAAANPNNAPKIPVRALQRKEHLGDIILGNLDTVYNMPTQGGLLDNTYYLYGIELEAFFRFTNPASGGPTGVQGDAPYSFFERITVVGNHRVRGVQEPFFDIRGAELHEYQVYWYGRQPFIQPAALSVLPNATNDIRIIMKIPFVPENFPWWEKIKYLCDAPNYDSFKLNLTIGSDKSIFTGQTTAPTLGGFGGTGSATVAVSAYRCLGGKNQFSGYVPGRVWRTFQEETVQLVNGGNGLRLFNINRGYLVTAMLLKTGVKSTAVNPGENVYNTLTNTALNNIILNRGTGRQIRKWRTFYSAQQDAAISLLLAIQPDTGYALLTFTPDEFAGEALNTKQYITGPTGEIDVFLSADVTAQGSNAAEVLVTEELREAPFVLTA